MSEPRPSYEELAHELQRYRAVYGVMRALGGTLELDRLLALIIERITEVMEADRSSLFLIDWEKEELWSKVAQGIRYSEIRFPMNMGLAGHVAVTGETLNIPDAYLDERFNQEFDQKTGYRTRSVLCVPMNNKQAERIGVIQVLNKNREGIFDLRDQEMLCSLAGQAAVAVENAQLYEEQKRSFVSFVETLATAMDARDPITAGHSRRVTAYSLAIAEQIGYGTKDLELLNVSSLLHDIGKIGVPEVVLFKDGRLSDEEYRVIQSHATHTLNILNKIHFDREKRGIPMMAATHHERLDGKGYPLGLEGDAIPEAGRIMAIGDVFDAITSRRHYRDRMDFCKVLSILQQGRGTHFQPEYLDAFFALTLARVVSILEAENIDEVDAEDMERFNRITLNDFCEWLQRSDQLEGRQRRVVDRFQYYYQRHLPADHNLDD